MAHTRRHLLTGVDRDRSLTAVAIDYRVCAAWKIGKGIPNRKVMLKRVLLLSASAGAGHLRAAEALEKAFRATAGDIEVQHLDVLNYTNKLFRHLYSKAYIDW